MSSGRMARRQSSDVQLFFCVAGLVGIAGFLSGCETLADRALRLSCSWNTDIVLKNCGRWSFARCIENCEYCIYGSGSQRGQSDECNQMKCAAFCANQEDDPGCILKYEELCVAGKAVYEKTTQSVCDVDCSSASKTKVPVLLSGALALLALHASAVPRKMLCLGLLILVASALQGCKNCWSSTWQAVECVECPKGVPSIPEFKPDLDEMDLRAGCKNEWNPFFGNPCASDVPIVLAKKGPQASQDYTYVIETVENEEYECLKTDGKYCQQWSAFEKSCKEQDYGVCTCSHPSDNGEFCQEWYCISKEADQHLCREACCGDDCTPCVQCAEHGTSPFQMNKEVFEKLLAKDDIALASNVLDPNTLSKLRGSYWGFVKEFIHPQTGRGECIANRDIHSPYEIPECRIWREIETEVSFCRCLESDIDKHYCHKWKCEEKDVGQFSILFSEQRSYEDNIDGQEVEDYTCTKVMTSDDGTKVCGEWKGNIASWEEIEVTLCTGCTDLASPHCKSWKCDEYEMPAILPGEITWFRRLGMSVAHFLWILPALVVGLTTCLSCCEGPFKESPLEGLMWSAWSLFATVLVVFVVISFGFWRYKGDEGRWSTPWQPLVGALLTMLVPYVFCLPLTCCMGDSENMMAFPVAAMAGGVATTTLVGLIWVCGFVLIGPIVLVALCTVCFCVVKSRLDKTEPYSSPLYAEEELSEENEGWLW